MCESWPFLFQRLQISAAIFHFHRMNRPRTAAFDNPCNGPWCEGKVNPASLDKLCAKARLGLFGRGQGIDTALACSLPNVLVRLKIKTRSLLKVLLGKVVPKISRHIANELVNVTKISKRNPVSHITIIESDIE